MRLLLPTLVELPLTGNLVLPVGFLLFGDFSRSSSSKTCERKYCPLYRFMVASLLFLISMASFTHLLYLFCSVPMTFALSYPMTWFFSTTWSVTADLWTDDSDCFLLALVTRFAHLFHFRFVFIKTGTKFAARFTNVFKITVHTWEAIQSVCSVVVISLVFWVAQKTMKSSMRFTTFSFTCFWWTASWKIKSQWNFLLTC